MSFRRRITRRQFIKGAAIAGGVMMLPIKYIGSGTAYAFAQSPGLKLWKTTLRGVGPGGIPVADKDGFTAPVTGVTH
ncbi:MAG TPA: twin-arginine translocation signal domain-containing protein, partial [Nitrospirota bacterium]|nr:twin-arginine translocation signal domain-containing protein [Nitrospirota bacterium]